MTDRLKLGFEDYGRYHRTQGNKLCHTVGIPMIMLSLLGLLAGVKLPVGDLGLLLWMIGGVYYLYLDWRVGLPFTLVSLGFYFASTIIAIPWLWGLFILGWIFQGIGHAHYEKNRPAFFKNVQHLLIGPLWIFARTIRYEP